MSAFCVHGYELLTRMHNIPRQGLGTLRESCTHACTLAHADTNKSDRKQIQEDSSLPNSYANAHIQKKREREIERLVGREKEVH